MSFHGPRGGGLTGWIGVAEEVSDISLACRQVGPKFTSRRNSRRARTCSVRRSLFFKKMQIVRGCDVKRNVLVCMVYSDKLIEGSPKKAALSFCILCVAITKILIIPRNSLLAEG